MTHSSADLKRMARAALNGKWGKAAAFSFLTSVITSILALCTQPFESSTSFLGMSVYWVITLIISLISGLFSAGTSCFYLNICRGEEFKYSDLFFAFKNNPDRFLIVALITGAATFISTLPTYFMNPVTDEDLIIYSLVSLVSIYIGAIISIIISLFFALSNYLLVDFAELGAIDSLRMSAHMMKGNKGRYFYISLSFIGWVFLAIFTLGIAFLWIEPYMNMTLTYFYEDILNQHQPQQEASASQTVYENASAYEQPVSYETPVVPVEPVVYAASSAPAESVVPESAEAQSEILEESVISEEAPAKEEPVAKHNYYTFESHMVDDDLFEEE